MPGTPFWPRWQNQVGGRGPPVWAVGHFCPGALVGLGADLGARGGLAGLGRGPQNPLG